MNNQEAQMILRAYRLGGQDTSDPLIAEALEQAQRDPELQKWLAEEHVFDLRVQAKLRTAMVAPPELKANLLALQKMARPVSSWQRPMWMSAAATAVLLLALATLWLRPGNSAQLDSFRNTMVRYSMQEPEHITFETSDTTKIQHWLQRRGMKTEFELPVGLGGKPAEGCRVVDWNGRKVTLICFVLADGNHVDFFVMDRADFPGLAGSNAPQFAKAGALMTVTWSKGNRVYLLTGGG